MKIYNMSVIHKFSNIPIKNKGAAQSMLYTLGLMNQFKNAVDM